MSEAAHKLTIEGIRETETTQPDLSKKSILFVEYILDEQHVGVLRIPRDEYSKEKVLELALKRLEDQHPDVGSEVTG